MEYLKTTALVVFGFLRRKHECSSAIIPAFIVYCFRIGIKIAICLVKFNKPNYVLMSNF